MFAIVKTPKIKIKKKYDIFTKSLKLVCLIAQVERAKRTKKKPIEMRERERERVSLCDAIQTIRRQNRQKKR
jgi:hypothetical protein